MIKGAVAGASGEWIPINIPFNVADVQKALLSTTKLGKQGHRVNLENDNNYIALKNSTKRVPLHIIRGCPVFTFWRKRSPIDPNLGFTGQAR